MTIGSARLLASPLWTSLLCVSGVLGHIDFGETLGSCNFPVLEAFSCRTLPDWGPFLVAMQENAKKGFPVDAHLYQQADDLMSTYGAKPYPPQDFFKYLCGGSEEVWPLADNFCLYGFVAALFIRARHLMMMEDEQVRKTAEEDLQYAATVLGKEGSCDFLDSSPWPFSIIDIYININETRFLSFANYKQERPIPAPIVPLHFLHWQDTTSATFHNWRMPPTVLAAIVGTHATLSLEPVNMLQRFVPDVQLEPIFFGLESRWCELMGICNQGTAALSNLFKAAEKDPFGYSWATMLEEITAIYDGDGNLQSAKLLICTEPLAGCLMLRQVAASRNRHLPLLGYFGVALLNACPPEDLASFWRAFSELFPAEGASSASAVLAVNNLILTEQIAYQSGVRIPYVRAHGLYTNVAYMPTKLNEVLFWRAPLFLYTTARCSLVRLLHGVPQYPLDFRFVEESESLSYQEMVSYRAVVLLPWDHALMTFYELYSANVPLLLPDKNWMMRLVYSRGQLSVGERMYQAIRPGHTPPNVEFAENEQFMEKEGPPDPRIGMASAKAARGIAEDMLNKAMVAEDLDGTKQYVKNALDLVWDMKYFLTVAENKTMSEDSYSSMGVVRRSGKRSASAGGTADASEPVPVRAIEFPDAWHPYTPFQMSTRDSNDWTRMRKGGWWLRRGVRFDAMRYWYQFSDFARFPGIEYFENLPDLLCRAESLDIQGMTVKMRRYNEETLVHSASFWIHSLVTLLGEGPASS